MNQVETSIIIVSYNCETIIEDCIKSAIDQPQSETIVIENASCDTTINILNQFEGKITIINNSKNHGFTYGCNQGIEIAKGNKIFLLNPDTILYPDTVTNLCKILDNNPDIGATAPVLFNPDGSVQNYTRRFPTVLGLWVESFIPMKLWNYFQSYKRYTCFDLDFTKDQVVDQPAGAAIMFRRGIILDKEYYIYGSDLDLCKSIYNLGYKILQTPSAKVVHHGSKGGTSTSDPKLRAYLDLDNYYGLQYYFKKNRQLFDLWLYRLLFLIGLFFSMALCLFRKPYMMKYKFTKFIGFLRSYNFRNYVFQR